MALVVEYTKATPCYGSQRAPIHDKFPRAAPKFGVQCPRRVTLTRRIAYR
jgi:hypothetical protein